VTTAFQPDLFQSNSFQIDGGVAATDFQATIAVVQGSDTVRIELRLPLSEGAAGRKRRKRERYIAKYKGEEHLFDSLQDLEIFVELARKEQISKPKKVRSPVKITLSPDFIEEIQPVIEYPKRIESMPTGAAMAQIRRIDTTLAKLLAEAQKAADEDEELCLMCLL